MAAWEPPNKGAPRNQTPSSFDMPSDPNQAKEAGQNMRYWAFKDRAGNMFMMNHQDGYENITLEHRTGSKFQLLPDGTVYLNSNKGRYTMIFGEDRIQVTGSHDIVVKGAASMRVEGDYNVTAAKNMNFNVAGNFTLKALNANIGADCFDIAAKNMSGKVSGAINLSAGESATILSEKGMAIGSSGDSLALVGGKQVALFAGTELMAQSGDKMSFSSGGEIAMEGEGDVSIKSTGSLTAESVGKMSLKSGGEVAAKSSGTFSIEGSVISASSGSNLSSPPFVAGSSVVGTNSAKKPDDANDNLTLGQPDAKECGKPTEGAWGPSGSK